MPWAPGAGLWGMERPLHCPCPPPVPELAKEPGAPALMPGATLVLPCLMPCGPGAQEHLAWFQIDWTGSEPPSQAVTSILPSPSPSCSPGGKGPAGAAPKALWGLTQNLAPEPRCRVWGFTTALCPGGLPLVGKMLADPEPVPSDRQCPMFGPKGGVETRLGSSGPVCLLTRTFPSCTHSPCAQEGRVGSRAEARLHDTQARESLDVPCSCQGGSDDQAFSRIRIPVGSQQPLMGGPAHHPSRSESAPRPPRPVWPHEGLWALAAPGPSQREVGRSEARPRGPSSEAQTLASSALTARPCAGGLASGHRWQL